MELTTKIWEYISTGSFQRLQGVPGNCRTAARCRRGCANLSEMSKRVLISHFRWSRRLSTQRKLWQSCTASEHWECALMHTQDTLTKDRRLIAQGNWSSFCPAIQLKQTLRTVFPKALTLMWARKVIKGGLSSFMLTLCPLLWLKAQRGHIVLSLTFLLASSWTAELQNLVGKTTLTAENPWGWGHSLII